MDQVFLSCVSSPSTLSSRQRETFDDTKFEKIKKILKMPYHLFEVKMTHGISLATYRRFKKIESTIRCCHIPIRNRIGTNFAYTCSIRPQYRSRFDIEVIPIFFSNIVQFYFQPIAVMCFLTKFLDKLCYVQMVDLLATSNILKLMDVILVGKGSELQLPCFSNSTLENLLTQYPYRDSC